jgi:subtilase family serine protease
MLVEILIALIAIIIVVFVFVTIQHGPNMIASLITATIVFALVILVIYHYSESESSGSSESESNMSTTAMVGKSAPQVFEPFHHLLTEANPYTPQQVASAYLSDIPYGGAGQKIAIITCFRYIHLQRDFDIFCNKYQLKQKNLILHGNPRRTNRGWNIETALDTQWAHVFAPDAEIHVFQAMDNKYTSLKPILEEAVQSGMDIISMSLGSNEHPYPVALIDHIFQNNQQVVSMASAGNWQTISYPSSSNSVISVGGSRLFLMKDGLDNRRVPKDADYSLDPERFQKLGETGWFLRNGLGTGHGISQLFARPSYQDEHNVSVHRATPDLCLISATPSQNGVSIYCGRWLGVEGTSLSCPVLAGMLATINSTRLSQNKTKLDRSAFLSAIYDSIPTDLPTEPTQDGAGFVGRRLIPHCVGM